MPGDKESLIPIGSVRTGGSFERCPRHFVPGYDRTVRPGLGASPFGTLNHPNIP
jgi:hypothetical protein